MNVPIKIPTLLTSVLVFFLISLLNTMLWGSIAQAQDPSGMNALKKKAAEIKKQQRVNPSSATPSSLSSSLPGNDTFVFSDIRIEGLVDIDPKTVFTYLPIQSNEEVTSEQIQAAIQNLYGTRLFENVSMVRDGDILVVTVVERKIISELNLENTYEFEAETMKESLRAVGLSEGKLVDPALITTAEQELKKQYLARGFYGVRITRNITEIDKRRVAVTLHVDEGEVAIISHIKILGNQQISTDAILNQMDSTDSALLDRSKRYIPHVFNADLERIRAYYLDRGFLDFQVDHSQASISPDLKSITLTIGLHEGPIYTVRSIALSNPNEKLSEEIFSDLVDIEVGDIYAQNKINNMKRAIHKHLSEQGFAQARIEVQKIKSSDPENHSVALHFNILEGIRMVVRKINIIGNTRTSDEVIRREFRLHEGGLFDSALLDKSRQHIERLSFFSDVELSTIPIPEMHDQIDIEARVTEKRTGSLKFGIGSSNTEKVSFQASVSQNNWLGTGRSFSLAFNTSSTNRRFTVSYYDPYVTQWGIGLGFSAYRITDDSSKLSTGKYKVTSTGIGGRVSYPLGDDARVSIGLRAGKDAYTLFSDSPTKYKDFVNNFSKNPSDILWKTTFSLDKRNSYIYPTQGIYFNVSTERTFARSNLQYQRIFASFQAYFPISERTALLFNTNVGKVTPLKGQPIPFSKKLYTGGIGSVRGYQYGSLGPYDSEANQFVGGDRNFNTNVELLLPFPGSQRSREARIAFFADTGMAWAKGESTSSRKLRSSYGIALSWSSPIGPLRFSYAFPINKKSDDKIERFQFHVGTTF